MVFGKTGGTSKNWLQKYLPTLFLCQGTCCPRSSCPTLPGLQTSQTAHPLSRPGHSLTGWLVQYSTKLYCSPVPHSQLQLQASNQRSTHRPPPGPGRFLEISFPYKPASHLILFLFFLPPVLPHPHSFSPVTTQRPVTKNTTTPSSLRVG